MPGVLEPVQLGEKETSMSDGVDTHIVAAAVGRSAYQLHIEPGESAVGGADRQPGWLGDDCLFSANSCGEKRAHAETLVFFVGNSGDENLPP
jgi:hypothetical protein